MHKGSWCDGPPRFVLQSYYDAFQILGYFKKLQRTGSLGEESARHTLEVYFLIIPS